jgi:hypothetical protein
LLTPLRSASDAGQHVSQKLAAGEDFRYPEVEGPKAPGTDLISRYVARVHQAATRDPEVYRAFLNVMHLMKPPTVLFHPLRDNPLGGCHSRL